MGIGLARRPGPIDDGSPVVPAAVLGLLGLAVLATYWPTTAAMVATWARSGTFTHGFLVLPVAAWLLWRRRAAIAAAPPAPTAVGLVLLALLVVVWWVADQLSAQALAQLSVVLMIPALVLAALGRAVLGAAAFPLLFALFAVPVGEFLLPPMMDLTANGSVALLALSGVPVFRDGWLISIPQGNFQVAEACSGVRYLIAAVCTAVLFSWLFFRSLKKRILFIAFTAFFTVLANVLRAYIIILLAHLTDMRLAVGVDHFVYGWFLFSLLLVVVLLVGLKFADPPLPAHAGSTPWRFIPDLRATPASFVAFLAVAAAILLSGPGLRSMSLPAGAAASAVPEVAAGARFAGPVDLPTWIRPTTAASVEAYRYEGDVSLDIVVIRGAGAGADVSDLRNYVSQRSLSLASDGRAAGSTHGEMRLESSGGGFVIGYWFTVGGQQTANRVIAKIIEAVTIFRGEHQRPALIAVALDTKKLDQPTEALRRVMPAVMDAFNACQAGAIDATADSTTGCRSPAATPTG